jgi:hypothetical protein
LNQPGGKINDTINYWNGTAVTGWYKCKVLITFPLDALMKILMIRELV